MNRLPLLAFLLLCAAGVTGCDDPPGTPAPPPPVITTPALSECMPRPAGLHVPAQTSGIGSFQVDCAAHGINRYTVTVRGPETAGRAHKYAPWGAMLLSAVLEPGLRTNGAILADVTFLPGSPEATWLTCETAHDRRPAIELDFCIDPTKPLEIHAMIIVRELGAAASEENSIVMADGTNSSWSSELELRHNSVLVPLTPISYTIRSGLNDELRTFHGLHVQGTPDFPNGDELVAPRQSPHHRSFSLGRETFQL